jgi:uncharacterized protein (DUF1499 family)
LDIPFRPFNITFKTDRNDVSEILSKVLLAAITQQSSQYIILKSSSCHFLYSVSLGFEYQCC